MTTKMTTEHLIDYLDNADLTVDDFCYNLIKDNKDKEQVSVIEEALEDLGLSIEDNYTFVSNKVKELANLTDEQFPYKLDSIQELLDTYEKEYDYVLVNCNGLNNELLNYELIDFKDDIIEYLQNED